MKLCLWGLIALWPIADPWTGVRAPCWESLPAEAEGAVLMGQTWRAHVLCLQRVGGRGTLLLGLSSALARGDLRTSGEARCGGGARRSRAHETRQEMEDEAHLELTGGCCAGGTPEGCSLCGQKGVMREGTPRCCCSWDPTGEQRGLYCADGLPWVTN